MIKAAGRTILKQRGVGSKHPSDSGGLDK